MGDLAIDDVRFAVGDKEILRGVSLEVVAGETVALLGPSGCGKTTLLRVVAGLAHPTGGTIWFGGEDVTGVPPHRRGFGMMFQEHALFPHMSVRRNVEYGLRQGGWSKERRTQRVDELLESVGLAGFGNRPIDGLSGGERQRVALARTLAPEPRLLMLDEPLGSLDRGLRERLVVELGDVLHRLGIPALYVTHDQFEAFAIADRVAIMRAGLIMRVGTPAEVYADPSTEFVARFLGLDTIVQGTLRPDGMVETAAGMFGPVEGTAGPVTLLLRGEGAHVVEGPGPNVLAGTVEASLFQGAVRQLVVRVGGVSLAFAFEAERPIPAPGEPVFIRIAKVQALEAEG